MEKLNARQRAGLRLARALPFSWSWKLLKIPAGQVSARDSGEIVREVRHDLSAAIPSRTGYVGETIGSEVFAFKNGYSTHWGANLTAKGEVISDLSRQGIGVQKPHFSFGKPRWKKARRIRGSVATLTIEHRSNYYHFLSDAMARVQLIQNLQRPPDYLYVQANRPYQTAILTRLGYSAAQIIDSSAHPYIQADELLVPAYASEFTVFTPDSIAFLRANLRPDPARPAISKGRIVYISRKDSDRRQMEGEAELLERLSPFGVETATLSELSLDQQIDLFESADAVITITGAGLANLIFARPEMLLVLITPPEGFGRTALNVVKPFGLNLCHIIASNFPTDADAYRQNLSLTLQEVEQIHQALAAMRNSGKALSRDIV